MPNRKKEMKRIRGQVVQSVTTVLFQVRGGDTRLFKGDENIGELLGNNIEREQQLLSSLETELDIKIPYDGESFLKDNSTINDLFYFFTKELMIREGIAIKQNKQNKKDNRSFWFYLFMSPLYLIRFLFLLIWWTIKYTFLAIWWVIKLPFRIIGWILDRKFFVIWWG
ncbi:hypothetical protein GH741_01105 [Aquibacillus halophilus]|uniref:Uncharacterized protein n=1 Tax=Aquibacillus halophilus TaxID=930132 RepID=A0A6A8D6Q8_9BACI|nr:hypothetical protein [Aquibacillus halophilus]MRH41268.1 hypothetical protein [Aquibacillus halophilus]